MIGGRCWYRLLLLDVWLLWLGRERILLVLLRHLCPVQVVDFRQIGRLDVTVLGLRGALSHVKFVARYLI